MKLVRIALFAGALALALAAPARAADSVAQTSSCAGATTCATTSGGAATTTGWGVKMNLTAAKQWPKVVLVWMIMAAPVYLSARRRLLPGQS